MLGSRYVAGRRGRRLGPRAAADQPRAAAPTRGPCSALAVRDLTGGFKCFRREVLEAIDLDTVSARGYAFQVEMTYRAVQAGFRVVEVPIVFRDRRVGRVEDEPRDRRRGGLAGAVDAPSRQPLGAERPSNTSFCVVRSTSSHGRRSG